MSVTKYYYGGGNTSIGYFSLFNQLVKSLKHVYLLKGGPGTGKSSFIKQIGSVLEGRGFAIDYLSNPTDKDCLDGLIVPALKLGMFAASAPQNIEPIYPGIIGKVIDLMEFSDLEKLQNYSNEIIRYTDEINDQYETAYEKFAKGVSIHKDKEEIYLSSMDFNMANKVTEQLIQTIFSNETEKPVEQVVRNLFFGASTSEGVLNYIENITQDINKRYIIKGRSGSGKSTVMRKIGHHAQKLGYSVDYFPCGLDPHSLDMVVIQPLNVTILDGTAPHVIDPSRDNDEVVDMFELCMNPQVEKDNADKLNDLDKIYKGIMKEGLWHLQLAKRLNDVLEEFYQKSMDFEQVDRKREEVLQEILALV